MRRDAVWSGVEACVASVLSVVSSFVAARIIGPAELGAGAAIVGVHVVLWVAVNALFADALVQTPSVNDRVLSSAFWASSGVGCVAGLLQVAAGFGLAALLSDNRLVAMGLMLAAPMPLVGAGGVIQGLLTRERAYRSLALRTLIGQTLGTATLVLAAFAGAGAWALAEQQAAASAIGALALLLGRRWYPAWCFDPVAVRGLLRVGGPLTASTLVLIARYRLFAVLIGGLAGTAILGQVHMAFRLVDTVRELAFTALWRLMLPRLAEHQHSPPALLKQVDQWVRWCSLAVLPLCGAMCLGLHLAVTWLLGSRWAEAGHVTMPLIGLMAWSAITFPAGVALIAAGQARFALHGNLLSLLAASASVLVVCPTSPMQAVTIWAISQLLVCPYGLWVNARALRVGLLRPLTGGFQLSGRPW